MSSNNNNKAEQYHERTIPFQAGDERQLNLINVRLRDHPPSRSPVILVHGAGVRANIFRAPVQTDIVDALLEQGYDVWLENWRASIDFPANKWTLDQAALYDHPEAVKKIIEETGAESIKAIIHCQGSTSFTMSAITGLIPQVDTIVTNAVSSHPLVPAWSRFKLIFFVPVVSLISPYLNPHWGVDAPNWFAKFITLMVNLTHHECNNAVCKQVSFTYGAGCPALWKHENISAETHEWVKQEFSDVPLRFFRQIAECVSKGHLVSVENFPQLPQDFTAEPPKTDARFAFFAGQQNRCFLPQSQINAFHYFDKLKPDFHSLHLIEKYSHLDIFMGSNAAQDTFPLILEELNK